MTFERSLPARTAASASPPLRQLSGYRLIEKLSEGATAAVHKAYDSVSDRFVAIKLLHAELCRDEECRARFLGEAQTAGRLSHPNIVTVLGSGEIEGRPYIAMEWLDGRLLSKALADGRALPLSEVLDIGIQLAGVLDYVHASGIVHGDVKPGNIIRAASGAIKLTDFGIARMPAAEAAAPAQSGAVAGTPHYMSPEHVLGRTIDARSDLWALGVILYQLVSGKRPFEANSIVTLRYLIAYDGPPPLEALREDIPPGLCRIIERCLRKSPDERYQSARELADALALVLRRTALDHAAA